MSVLRPLAAAGPTEDLLALLLALAVLITAAKLMGALAVRFGQPAVLGELTAGILVGPSVLNVLASPLLESNSLSAVIHQLGQLGVIWLMFAAGLETDLQDLRKTGKPAVLAGTLGVLSPMLLGTAVAGLFGTPLAQALFFGVVLSATSVSISAQTLLELGRLRSQEGIALLAAAVVDDVLVIVLLSIFVAVSAGAGSPLDLLTQFGQMAAVLLVVSLLAITVLPKLAERSSRLRASEGLLAVSLSAVLFLAWAVEYLGGVAAITGAFLAGVGLARSHLKSEIEAGLHKLAFAFFVPLFLIDIGLQADLRTLDSRLAGFALAIVAIAVISKVLGSGLGARLGGFDSRAAFRVGLGMISRGEVGLIVAGVGLASDLLTEAQFSVVVLMILTTTLITPPLLRWAYSREESSDGATADPGSP